ncbi:tRNA (N6-threonylcarbamoyladenosine(37)-N6)-methyltransferase TrmO [Bdellovibrio reynosensis]|uniref:tRNA (N6-threonylcarbamoyladenosine(37)-N6)-methyltransferase TrmO n=1 Tax=Bdellovibrio reynosensis TaxID=2835041 RepID=A0ABY4CB56_9BACT|nr:tRNA (N6-threonylcarbamoyladenosine(37)-N6)-methyltransferase TrmO [Bdellovibrio reynosensis]UOF02212.1 tRNA (N6-threonylcarbamoyladenosine(37)-N6)-methyltransferase TrmO [Bdellovibrio reynosensis]
MASAKIEISPIGIFRTSQVHPYEAGRQPDEFHAEGCIELESGHNFEQALTGLDGCERIWIIFHFHHNPDWQPMVLPPRGSDTKLGVFATRSPYRPNGIGMSCVKVARIEKLKIFVSGADILDGSPVLDIKPYVAYADSFPGVEPAWLKNAEKHVISFSERAKESLRYLDSHGVTQLRGFLLHQLEYEPTNSRKKRVKAAGEEFVIAYRTWRARFSVAKDQVQVLEIFSGYSSADLENADDPYADKIIHKQFKKLFQPLS